MLSLILILLLIAGVLFLLHKKGVKLEIAWLQNRNAHLALLVGLALFYYLYEVFLGVGTGANIRIDWIVIIPLVTAALFFSMKPLIQNTLLRLIASISGIVLLFLLAGITAG